MFNFLTANDKAFLKGWATGTTIGTVITVTAIGVVAAITKK